MTRRPIELHIEQLVLHGFSGDDRHAIAQAVERQVMETLHQRGVTPRFQVPGAVEHLNAGEVRLGRGMQASDIGQHIGRKLSGVFTG